MQRVQVLREGLQTLSVANIEYEVDEDGRVEVQEGQLPHFEAHPHLFKIIGPEQVLGPRPGLTPKPSGVQGPRPKGLVTKPSGN